MNTIKSLLVIISATVVAAPALAAKTKTVEKTFSFPGTECESHITEDFTAEGQFSANAKFDYYVCKVNVTFKKRSGDSPFDGKAAWEIDSIGEATSLQKRSEIVSDHLEFKDQYPDHTGLSEAKKEELWSTEEIVKMSTLGGNEMQRLQEIQNGMAPLSVIRNSKNYRRLRVHSICQGKSVGKANQSVASLSQVKEPGLVFPKQAKLQDRQIFQVMDACAKKL